MAMQESGEMYLETIYRLTLNSSYVRAIDVGEALGYSKPSVSRGMSILKRDGHILVARDGNITLTESGRSIAEKIYERHVVLSKLFEFIGVDKDIAAKDACKIEHVISDETFVAIKEVLKKHQEKGVF